jgi:predicted nucleotide-binding protein (sugar kinase/HSP70/actin superfamily)
MGRMGMTTFQSKGPTHMKIGIPNTLFSSYHLPYWRQLLTLLNLETVLSDASTPEIAQIGGKLLPHEFCLPVKVFIGHIVNLVEKKVDRILLPFMNNPKKCNYSCPKLIGLADIVKYTVGLEERFFWSPEITCDGLQIKMTKIPQPKITAPAKFKQLESQANQYWETILRQCRAEKLTLGEINQNLKLSKNTGELTLGVLGYAYTLYDPFIGKQILSKLNDLGVSIITWEMIEPSRINEHLKLLKRPIFWNFGKIVFGAGLYFLHKPEIDGVIYLSTFGCGPDSVLTKMLSLEAAQLQKPFLLLNLDEHLESGHIQTRLEAFTDMLAERKEEVRGREVI